MAPSTMDCAPDRALASIHRLEQRLYRMVKTRTNNSSETRTAPPPLKRLATSLNESPYDIHQYLTKSQEQRGTVLYLAYGSNLSNETFRGNRGIRPLSQINVQVPSLRLTFDLPGIPYGEPCFANSGSRDPENDTSKAGEHGTYNEKVPLLNPLQRDRGYMKDEWHKGLIGVVYEVTPEDYAHIIATEGGGSSYHDILVDCHAFVSSDPSTPVPQNPTLPPFKAHTLFAPATPEGDNPPEDGGRFQRPDTSYAQASARYLKLITDGAAECNLPYEYQDYLLALRPYTITSNKQRVGQFVFLSIWLPFVLLIFAMGRMFADEKGLLPAWLKQLTGAIFQACWASYDGFFKPLFGDGERSIPDGGEGPPDEEMGESTDGTGYARREHLPDLEKAAHDVQ